MTRIFKNFLCWIEIGDIAHFAYI